MNLIAFLIIGAIAGYLASLLTKGRSNGLIWNLIIGMIGAIIGGKLFGLLGIGFKSMFVGEIVAATVGAMIVIWVVKRVL
jgi:uncharacterized membrane protein YeaQ/YmgE (transglycosylase-associated protein family)